MNPTKLTKEDYTLILDVLGSRLDSSIGLPEHSIQDIERVYTKLYLSKDW